MSSRSFRAHLHRRALPALLAGAAPLALGACVSFDDAAATQGYFDFAGAARVCARIFSCPGLATSLRRSIAAPVDGQNFSTCMSWLAGPSPTPPGGFAAQSAVLAQVGAATSCDSAASGLDVVPLPADYPGCATSAGGGCTASGDVFDCAAGQIIRCPGSQHAVGSTCDAATLQCVSGCKTTVDDIGACSSGVLCEDPVPREQLVCSAYGQGCIVDTVTSVDVLNHPIDLALCTSPDNTDPAVCGESQAEGATACSGGAMVLCDHLKTLSSVLGTVTFGAVEVLYRCETDLGWPCTAPATGSIPYCERPQAACSPTDPGVNTCDGDVLVACVSGQSQRIDCSAAGASCQPESAGTTGAFCAFGP